MEVSKYVIVYFENVINIINFNIITWYRWNTRQSKCLKLLNWFNFYFTIKKKMIF